MESFEAEKVRSSFVVDHEKMAIFCEAYYDCCTEWGDNIGYSLLNLKNYINDSQFSGYGVTRLKEYIQTIHCNLLDDLEKLINLQIQAGLENYSKDITSIDDNKTAHYQADEIVCIKNTLDNSLKKGKGVQTDITTQLNSISDLIEISSWNNATSRMDFETSHENAITFLNKIIEDIVVTEQSHYNALSEKYNTIETIDKLIQECLDKDRDFRVNFDENSTQYLNSWTQYSDMSIKLEKDIDENREKYVASIEDGKKWCSDVKEYKKREDEAAFVNTLVDVGCKVFTIAAAVATGGSSLLITGAVTGCITGAVKSAVKYTTDAYVQDPNMSTFNSDEYWEKIFIGGAQGTFSGAIDAVVKIDIGIPVVGNVLEEVTTGFAKRLTNALIEEGYGWVFPKDGNRDFDWSKIGKAVWDTDEIVDDIYSGTKKGITKEFNKKYLDDYLNQKLGSDRLSRGFIVGSHEEVVWGVIDRAGNEIINGHTDSILEEALDKKQISLDILKGGMSTGTKNWGAGYKMSESDLRQDLEADMVLSSAMSSSPAQFVEDGGDIVHEANGDYTATDKNGIYIRINSNGERIEWQSSKNTQNVEVVSGEFRKGGIGNDN